MNLDCVEGRGFEIEKPGDWTNEGGNKDRGADDGGDASTILVKPQLLRHPLLRRGSDGGRSETLATSWLEQEDAERRIGHYIWGPVSKRVRILLVCNRYADQEPII